MTDNMGNLVYLMDSWKLEANLNKLRLTCSGKKLYLILRGTEKKEEKTFT